MPRRRLAGPRQLLWYCQDVVRPSFSADTISRLKHWPCVGVLASRSPRECIDSGAEPMSGYGNAQPMEARTSVPDRHLAAVTRSLQWAQDSADRGDYADAIAWHRAVEATGDELSPAHQTKHEAWRVALVHSEAARRRF